MENYRQKYEHYWSGKDRLDSFYGYERNRALPLFFKSQKESFQKKVLDVGCGDGAVSKFLKNQGFDVVSLDISINALLKAKDIRQLNKCILADAEYLPFKNESFDTIFWGDNIEHLFYPTRVLDEIYRVLKKEGEVVISFPNMSYWHYRVFYILHGMIPKTEGSNNEPWEWEHIRFFNRKIIKKMLNKSGFILERVIGVSNDRMENKLAKKFDLFASILVVSGKKYG